MPCGCTRVLCSRNWVTYRPGLEAQGCQTWGAALAGWLRAAADWHGGACMNGRTSERGWGGMDHEELAPAARDERARLGWSRHQQWTRWPQAASDEQGKGAESAAPEVRQREWKQQAAAHCSLAHSLPARPPAPAPMHASPASVCSGTRGVVGWGGPRLGVSRSGVLIKSTWDELSCFVKVHGWDGMGRKQWTLLVDQWSGRTNRPLLTTEPVGFEK